MQEAIETVIETEIETMVIEETENEIGAETTGKVNRKDMEGTTMDGIEKPNEETLMTTIIT